MCDGCNGGNGAMGQWGNRATIAIGYQEQAGNAQDATAYGGRVNIERRVFGSLVTDQSCELHDRKRCGQAA